MSRENVTDGALENFCVFVLSRLVRWEAAAAPAGTPARALLEQRMTRALSAELLRLAQDEGQVPCGLAEAGARVAGWLAARQRLAAAEAAFLDLVLFEVDILARQQLTGLMPAPPRSDPVGQLLLLRAAVAAHPRLWNGVAWRRSIAEALAVGLDLPAGSVPEIFVQRLGREHRCFSTCL